MWIVKKNPRNKRDVFGCRDRGRKTVRNQKKTTRNALQFQLSRVPWWTALQAAILLRTLRLAGGDPGCTVLILVRFELRDVETMVFCNVFAAQALIAKCRKRMAEINELKACQNFCTSCVWNRSKIFCLKRYLQCVLLSQRQRQKMVKLSQRSALGVVGLWGAQSSAKVVSESWIVEFAVLASPDSLA